MLGATVVAVSVESLGPSQEMVEKNGLTFPVAYGTTDDQVEGFHPLYNEGHHGMDILPIEFLLLRDSRVFGSMYASWPVGRMGLEERLRSIHSRERHRLERETEGAEAVKKG
jgi:peroxiredoxin